MSRSSVVSVVVTLLCGLLLTAPVAAGPFDKLKKKATKKVTRAVDKKVDKKMDEAVECVFGDKKCQEQAEAEGRQVVIVDDQGQPVDNPPAANEPAPAAAPGEQPGSGIWRNYDYTPGRDVWRHIVFDDEKIGRFPAGQLEFVKGNMQIVELDGKRVLEVAGSSVFRVQLDEVLPEDFTLEFELQIGASNIGANIYFSPLETALARYDSYYVVLYHSPGISFRGSSVSNIGGQHHMARELTPIRLQVDGQYTILYVGTERAANIPNAQFARTSAIEFHVGGNANYRSYIADINVAVGVDDMYESLMESGSFTTRGIYFDVGSHAIRPESTPTLIQIENTLKRHAELQVRIEGHTDSSGDDASNQTLSERRAQAVVTYLAAQGVDAARLEPVGLGEARPVADNATPAGRQQNRRVVFALKK